MDGLTDTNRCRFCILKESVATLSNNLNSLTLRKFEVAVQGLNAVEHCGCGQSHPEFVDMCRSFLCHDEARVRSLVAQCLEYSFQHPEPSAMVELFPIVTSGLQDNLIRTATTRTAILGDVGQISLDDTDGWSRLESFILSYHCLLLSAIIGNRVDILALLLEKQLLQVALVNIAVHQSRRVHLRFCFSMIF